MLYTDTYIWNLKRCHWRIYFQGSNGETDTENRPMDTVGGEEGEGEMYGESNVEIYNTICKIDSNGNLLYNSENSNRGFVTGWSGGGKGDRREVQEGEDMGILVADSCWCMTENHKILYSNYPSIKKWKKTKNQTWSPDPQCWHHLGTSQEGPYPGNTWIRLRTLTWTPGNLYAQSSLRLLCPWGSGVHPLLINWAGPWWYCWFYSLRSAPSEVVTFVPNSSPFIFKSNLPSVYLSGITLRL